MKLRFGIAALLVVASATNPMAQPAGGAGAAPTPDSLVAAAKRAAGDDFVGTFPGTFARLCVAPDNAIIRPPRPANAAPPAPRPAPDPATWYAKPYKVFDNLYWVGTKIHNSWALTTSQGIILLDTLYAYADEREIIDGLKTLKLDPKNIKYAIITHAHGDHDQGAALLQSRFGTKIVMGTADWDAMLERPATYPGGVPKKDIAVGPEGLKLTLGDTTVNIIYTPGHTPGTLSMIFTVKDHGRPLVVAYSGGTAFNFPRTAENFAIYEASEKKMAAAAKAAGATVLMSNHSDFDQAWDRVRAAQVPRGKGEPHPMEVDANAIQRYFTIGIDCAEAQRLSMQ